MRGDAASVIERSAASVIDDVVLELNRSARVLDDDRRVEEGVVIDRRRYLRQKRGSI